MGVWEPQRLLTFSVDRALRLFYQEPAPRVPSSPWELEPTTGTQSE